MIYWLSSTAIIDPQNFKEYLKLAPAGPLFGLSRFIGSVGMAVAPGFLGLTGKFDCLL